MPKRGSLLQHELRQARPFDNAAHEATLGVIRTADFLKRQLTETLDAFGVSAQQYNVLRILRGAGDRGLPTLEIAGRMIEQAPGITRMVDRLEERGWASRMRCTQDRRVVYCVITAAGRDLVERVEAPLRAAEDRLMASLPEPDQRQLVALLDRIRCPDAT